MAFTANSKRLGYDNIAVGSVTGRENAVAVDTSGKTETTRLTFDQRGTSTSDLSQNFPEIHVDGWTSASSLTSDFVEIVG
jgi:hypothetical protein